MNESQRVEIEARETYLRDKKKVTSGESQDYHFENQNKILKKILPPNPTFEDFRTATLVKEDAEEVMKKVKSFYGCETINKEAGFPDYAGCVFNAREVFRAFLEKEEFENLSGQKICVELLEYEKVADERRAVFFQEINSFGKFTKCPHRNTKFQVLEKKKLSTERLEELTLIVENQFEDDPEERAEFMLLLNKVNFLKTEGEKECELDRIVSLL